MAKCIASIKSVILWGGRCTFSLSQVAGPKKILIMLGLCSVCRMGGELPKGVIPHSNGTLAFGRPLTLSDGGTYQCVAKNEVGEGKVEVEVVVTGR